MGLDACVMCNCYQEGKAKLTPFEIKIDLQEGGFTFVNPKDNNDENFWKLWEWKSNACSHSEMEIVSDRISNWPGVRLFQQALEDAGWNYFPILKAVLPNANGGKVIPELSVRALEEIDFFKTTAGHVPNTVLIASESGYTIQDSISSYGGIFAMSQPWFYGIFENYFYIQDATSQIVFRAHKFEQRLLQPGMTKNYEREQVEFVDIESGITIITTMAISGNEISCPEDELEIRKGKLCFEYPAKMHVEWRVVSPEYFNFITEPLAKVFQASVETNNPVYWT